jgi:hypothetical protein
MGGNLNSMFHSRRFTFYVFFFRILILGVFPLSAYAEGSTLKEQFFIQEAAPLKKAQACDKVVFDFNNQKLDRFVSNSSRLIGVDLRGRIWEVKKNPGGICGIENIARIGVDAYQKNATGETEKIVYYYEPDSICAYIQSTNELRRVRRLCYQPIGIVNKYAPYKSP